MLFTLHGIGSGPIARLAGSSNASAVGYILGSSGLDLYGYKLGRENETLNDPATYLTNKKNAVDALINLRRIKNDINCKTFTIGQTLGFPGAVPGVVPPNSNAYALVAAPFVRDMATNIVLKKLKRGLAIIDIQFPSSIDEVAKKKQKKRIKSKVEAGDHL